MQSQQRTGPNYRALSPGSSRQEGRSGVASRTHHVNQVVSPSRQQLMGVQGLPVQNTHNGTTTANAQSIDAAYSQNQNELQDQTNGQSQVPGQDIDLLVMNVYSKMKNLENKYIDLANFYKESLVKEKEEFAASPSLLAPQHSSNQASEVEAAAENMMIRDLIEEKRELEENMNNMKSVLKEQRQTALPEDMNQK